MFLASLCGTQETWTIKESEFSLYLNMEGKNGVRRERQLFLFQRKC